MLGARSKNPIQTQVEEEYTKMFNDRAFIDWRINNNVEYRISPRAGYHALCDLNIQTDNGQ